MSSKPDKSAPQKAVTPTQPPKSPTPGAAPAKPGTTKPATPPKK